METLRLNPNCCYKACPQCSSVRRLQEFQVRFPRDWAARLVGSPRLLAAAQQHDYVSGVNSSDATAPTPVLPAASAPVPDASVRCEECGAFGAVGFGHIALCPDCYAERGSCCAEKNCGLDA